MPSQYSKPEDLPIPKDARVHLVALPEKDFAVITIKGAMPRSVRDAKEQVLREAAGKEGVKLSSDASDVEVGSFNP
jgi:hypothetical protein